MVKENRPDLVIEDITVYVNAMGYTIKNIGESTSDISIMGIYLNGIEVSSDIAFQLFPGSSRSEYVEYKPDCTRELNTIIVCADYEDKVNESNETNNCLEKEWHCTITTSTVTTISTTSSLREGSTMLYSKPINSNDCSSITTILANKNYCDLKTVDITGKVVDVYFKTSQKGNSYTTYELKEGTQSLSVFVWGSPSIQIGQTAKVNGVYHAVKHSSGYTFYDQIDASTINSVNQEIIKPTTSLWTPLLIGIVGILVFAGLCALFFRSRNRKKT